MRRDISFEETYPTQPFSVLVRFGIWLGASLRRLRERDLRRLRERDKSVAGKPATA